MNLKKSWYLNIFKLKFYLLKKNTYFLSLIPIVLLLILNTVGLFLIKKAERNSYQDLSVSINFLIIIMSIFIFLVTIYLVYKIFHDDIRDNIPKLELRFGYKIKDLYFYRIMTSSIILLIIFLVILLINLAFGLPINNLYNLYAYKLYIASLGWYFITFLISYTLSLFIGMFLSKTISLLLLFLTLLFYISSIFIGGTTVTKGFNNNLGHSSISFIEMYKIEQKIKFKKEINKIDDKLIEQIPDFFDQITKTNFELEYFLVENSIYLGPNSWKNNYNFKKINENLFQNSLNFYNYFDNYFKNNTFDFDQNDLIGLNNDLNFQKKEPIVKLLKQMRLTIDAKYFDLIDYLISANYDYYALNILGINYNWKHHGLDEYLKRDFLNLTNFINKNKISSAEILFYKLLGKNFENQNRGFYYNNFIYEKKDDLGAGGSISISEAVPYEESWKKCVKILKRNVILSPLLQISSMFNSVNYLNFDLYNIINSQGEIFNGTLNYTFLGKWDEFNRPSDLNSFQFKRIIYPELIYLAYTIINVLIIFGTYFKFKKKITRN